MAELNFKEGDKKKGFRVDVSEVKSYKNCSRAWAITSRNKGHIRPIAPNMNFIFGTMFHEALHELYAKGPEALDNVLDFILKELTDPVHRNCMTAMITGYAAPGGPLIADLDRFRVLEIEHRFSIPVEGTDVILCGSIDMICQEKATGDIYGFEHKTAKSFRPAIYLHLDEQPRLYNEALKEWVRQKCLDLSEEGLNFAASCGEVKGVYVNQVKKVQKFFDYERVLCSYSDAEQEQFMRQFLRTTFAIRKRVEEEGVDVVGEPEPGYMKCQMCDVASICQHFGYCSFTTDQLMEEFEGEFEVRDMDHLDEKSERKFGKESGENA